MWRCTKMDKYEVWSYIICRGGNACTCVCGFVICCLHLIDIKSPDSSLRKPDKTKLIACISLRYVVQLRCMSLVSVKSPEAPIHDDVRSIFLTFEYNFCAYLLFRYLCWFNGMVWGQLEHSKHIGRRISLKWGVRVRKGFGARSIARKVLTDWFATQILLQKQLLSATAAQRKIADHLWS